MFDKKTTGAIVYWYFDFNDKDKQDVTNMLRSLIRQLAAASSQIPQSVFEIESNFRAAGRQPDLNILSKSINSIIADFEKDVFMVIDALDECPLDIQREELLHHITAVLNAKHEKLHLLMTSRREIDIYDRLERIVIAIDIQMLLEGDVKLFIESRLKNEPRLARWNSETKSLIRTKLIGVKEL